MNGFDLRPMGLADAQAIAALIREAFAFQPVTLDPPPSALGVTEAAVAEHLRTGGGAVAVSGGVLVGAILWEERDGLYVSRLAVAPRLRRRGVARALVDAAEAAGRACGAARLHLGTRIPLIGNRRLFAAAGFVEVARHAHAGYVAPTWVEMEKRLG